jgi:hypothetical protein
VFKAGDGEIIDSGDKAQTWLARHRLPRYHQLSKVFDQVRVLQLCMPSMG